MQYLAGLKADHFLQKELFFKQHAKAQMKHCILATEFDSSSHTVHSMLQVIQW